jgi:hypothetical protein
VARVVIIGALIVIVVASLILYKQLNHEVTPVQQVVGPRHPRGAAQRPAPSP